MNLFVLFVFKVRWDKVLADVLTANIFLGA